MEHLAAYLKTSAFIFFLSFKPSEPHLSKFLKQVKGLSDDQVNNSVYPVYTYTSLVLLVILASSKVIGMWRSFSPVALNDKSVILAGTAGRMATRLLLLFGTGLRAMQLMQVVFSLGIVAEVAFYAYVLKIVPLQHVQRLVAITQSCYLVAHTSAGLLGDALLAHTDIGLNGLMWISACSVGIAACIAFSLDTVDRGTIPTFDKPVALLRSVYSTRSFGFQTAWWTLNYCVYMTVYGYESSLYAEYLGKGTDWNGTIFAIGLLAGALTSLSLSNPVVEKVASRAALLTLAFFGIIMAAMGAIMGFQATNTWAVAIAFTGFFMAWSFANTLFYGETRRVVEEAVAQNGVGELGPRAAALTSAVFILNSSLSALAQSLVTLILFTWMQVDIAEVFQDLAITQGVVSFVVGIVGIMVLARPLRPAEEIAEMRETHLGDPLQR